MKKLILSCLVLLFGAMTVMAQETVHVVKRGETLSMIATQYGVSVDALKEANPLAVKMLYVGLKLQIPAKPATEALPSETQIPQSSEVKDDTVQDNTFDDQQPVDVPENNTTHNYKKQPGTLEGYGRAMFYFTDNAFGNSESGGGVHDYKSDFALAWDLGVNYYFVPSTFLYAGLSVITQGGTYSYGSGYGGTIYTTSTSRTSLRLPLGVGYNLPLGEHIGIVAQTGPMLNYLIAGYNEEKESGRQVSKTKLKDMEDVEHFSANWSASLGFVLWDFEIGAEYCIGLHEHASDIWGVYLGFRF